MSKLKLNIQYFGSTNKTTHYDLSQYVASDKPTYLIDYNQDMAKIDAGIYDAMSKATVNESNIGTMQDLSTTAKNNLVSAINELNTQLGANTSNIATNTSNIATLGTNQGELVNLMTTAKNNLVSAINELKGVNDTQTTNISKNSDDISTLNDEIQKFNLTSFKTYTATDFIGVTGGGTVSDASVTVATNSDGSIGKVYGYVVVNNPNANTNIIKKLEGTDLRPSSAITINACGIGVRNSDKNLLQDFMVIDTNGDISFNLSRTTTASDKVTSYLYPCLYFMKDFGDVNPE